MYPIYWSYKYWPFLHAITRCEHCEFKGTLILCIALLTTSNTVPGTWYFYQHLLNECGMRVSAGKTTESDFPGETGQSKTWASTETSPVSKYPGHFQNFIAKIYIIKIFTKFNYNVKKRKLLIKWKEGDCIKEIWNEILWACSTSKQN